MAMSSFKNFILRGNLVELAVAVVIGNRQRGLRRPAAGSATCRSTPAQLLA
jgi:hypothetical protein